VRLLCRKLSGGIVVDKSRSKQDRFPVACSAYRIVRIMVNDMLKRIELILADTTHVVGGHVDGKVMHAIRAQHRQCVQPRLQQPQHHVPTTFKTDTKSHHYLTKQQAAFLGIIGHTAPLTRYTKPIQMSVHTHFHIFGPIFMKLRY